MADSYKYDDARFHTRQQMVVGASTGVSVPGTAASDTELFRIPITDACTIDKIRIVAMTGGTAAGPTLKFGKSLAGTGSVSQFGTNAFGTNANNAAFSVSPTSTDFAAGDHLVITNGAGTAASTPKVIINVGWVEDFPG